ncbi:hypothetical protein [Paractinoplanes lichenicola]|uniref:Uncharacterized protein n=1 Tax=Paractinoplanes lichenicola TaxID=2802976 RepID=A0ABS1VM08_9ACTN|nr:hypothetical protein [Actinoplanes lichenicola]MBL7255761.1 hypothetical protein [Actinoplanes lichenicola]
MSEATPASFRLAGPRRTVMEGLLRADPGDRWGITRTRAALQEQSLCGWRGRHVRA